MARKTRHSNIRRKNILEGTRGLKGLKTDEVRVPETPGEGGE
jgi:hypothetical protein